MVSTSLSSQATAAQETAENPHLRTWLPGMVTLAAIWGCSFLFIGVGVRDMHPTYLTLGRVAFGSITLLIMIAILKQRLPRSPRIWAHLFVLGAVGATIPFTLFGYGEQRIPSLLAGIWNGTTPLFVLPIAVLAFRTEKFTKRAVAGLLLGFAGVLVVLGAWHGLSGAALTGQLMCLGAAVCYGVAIPYQKRFIASAQESGAALSAGFLLMSTVQLAIIAPLIAGAPPSISSLSGEALASVAALGALGTGVAFVLNMRNIRLVGASTASMVTYIIPVFAIAVGVIVLDEHISWYQPVGALIVLTGVAISQGAFRRKPAVPIAT